MDSDECAFELMSVFSLSNSLVTHIIILDKRSVSNLQSLNHQSAESEYTTIAYIFTSAVAVMRYNSPCFCNYSAILPSRLQ